MVVNANDRVIEQISSLKKDMHAGMQGLRNDMHDFKTDMNKRFSSLDNRVVAIETKLGTANQIHWLDHAKLIDYSFRAASLLLGAILTYVVIHFMH